MIRGLAAAELMRMRKRRSLQVIVLAVPLLVAFFFVLGHGSIYEPPPFDPVAYRAELIAQGYAIGLPPEEADRLLGEAVGFAQDDHERQLEYAALTRATFHFPYSLVTVLGYGTFVLLALVLLAATTTGDEFGWGTIRTTLLANSDRRGVLLVRVGALVVAAVVMLALLLLIGTILPFVLGVGSGRLPATLPVFDGGALLVLLGGLLLAAAAVIGLATLAPLLVRSGALTLVVVLVYVVVEAAILLALMRFQQFGFDSEGRPGELAWLLDAFPVRGLATLSTAAGQAASGLPPYPGSEVVRDLSPVGLPVVALTIAAAIFLALAFRRFQRMDIVE